MAVVARHIADVILGALVMMKEPTTMLLAVILFIALLAAAVSKATDITLTSIGSYKRRFSTSSPNILGHSSSGITLANDLKYAELAVIDLIGAVKGSNITVKEVLLETLWDFATDAKETARTLRRFSSKVRGTIDGYRAHFRYRLGLELKAPLSTGSSAVAARLDTLEERLVTAHLICAEEESITEVVKDELLSRLWTKLGGNKEQRLDLERRSATLLKVQEYRAVASAYVTAVVHALTGVDADLADLRERLVLPHPQEDDIPLQVHIASIQRSLYRLNAGKEDRRVGLGELQRLEGQSAANEVEANIVHIASVP
ncbi:hypothetical protein C8Q79DRAFT_928087 [Trametes meyenii]|nr:hypothetical protein C8Q79DRAFT_928087 [Trametes meyenii]